MGRRVLVELGSESLLRRSNDTGYTPQNKPAQAILQQYYGGPGVPPPPHGAPTQTLFSWESGVQGWQVPSFAGIPASIAQATKGATAGQHSLAVTQTGGGFSWDAYVPLTGDALNAFSLAFTDNHANYRLEFDVTYDTASIPQNATLNFLNESVAIQNAAGTWSQVDSVGSTNGHTNQTIHVAIPLARWTGLTAGSSSYTIYFGLNGNWGSSSATVFFDNLALVNLTAPLTGDFNHDGKVDMADYVVWRDTLGSTSNLAADANLNGVVDTLDYQLWRGNFGAVGAGGAGLGRLLLCRSRCRWLLLGVAVMVLCVRPREFGWRCGEDGPNIN